MPDLARYNALIELLVEYVMRQLEAELEQAPETRCPDAAREHRPSAIAEDHQRDRDS